MSPPCRFYVLVLIVQVPNRSLCPYRWQQNPLENCRRSLDKDAVADNALWRERHIQPQKLHGSRSSAILHIICEIVPDPHDPLLIV